jgi:hypothetical protein
MDWMQAQNVFVVCVLHILIVGKSWHFVCQRLQSANASSGKTVVSALVVPFKDR